MKNLIKHLQQDWYKYVLEIIVIVGSILGAFALEKWNEKRKSEDDKVKIVSQLIKEYETNIQQLDSKIEIRKTMITQAKNILKLVDDPNSATYQDILDNIVFFNNDPTFDPIKNDLLQTGNLRILDNDSLRNLLTSWDADLRALRERELSWQEYTQTQVIPFFDEVGLTRDHARTIASLPEFGELWQIDQKLVNTIQSDIGQSKNKTSTKEILSYRKLEGIAAHLIGQNMAANWETISIRSKMDKTLELLRKEI